MEILREFAYRRCEYMKKHHKFPTVAYITKDQAMELLEFIDKNLRCRVTGDDDFMVPSLLKDRPGQEQKIWNYLATKRFYGMMIKPLADMPLTGEIDVGLQTG